MCNWSLVVFVLVVVVISSGCTGKTKLCEYRAGNKLLKVYRFHDPDHSVDVIWPRYPWIERILPSAGQLVWRDGVVDSVALDIVNDSLIRVRSFYCTPYGADQIGSELVPLRRGAEPVVR